MKALTKTELRKIADARFAYTIDHDTSLRNLAVRHECYDNLLAGLYANGWVRFAAGFKSGIYGHPDHQCCIKLAGMGVGDDPLYFAGKGWVLAHEHRMLDRFREKGFCFGPKAETEDASVEFLVTHCGLEEHEARRHCRDHHLLIIDRIAGIPFATQTGHFLNYRTEIALFGSDVLLEAQRALRQLRGQLQEANAVGLVHNDPMPANIIFVLNSKEELVAKLLDFELAQDLNEESPGHVGMSVAALYPDRDVPRNSHNGRYIKNFDQHVMDSSLEVIRELRASVQDIELGRSSDDWFSVGFSLLGLSFSINVIRFIEYARSKLT